MGRDAKSVDVRTEWDTAAAGAAGGPDEVDEVEALRAALEAQYLEQGQAAAQAPAPHLPPTAADQRLAGKGRTLFANVTAGSGLTDPTELGSASARMRAFQRQKAAADRARWGAAGEDAMSQPNVPFGLLTNRSVRLESWDMEYATNSTSVNAPPAGGGEQAKRWAPCAATPRFGTPLGRTDKHQRAKRTHGPVAAPNSEVLAHLVLLACPAGFAPQLWQHVAALSAQCRQLLVRLPRVVRTAGFRRPDSWH